jgi:RES domain-containing protein
MNSFMPDAHAEFPRFFAAIQGGGLLKPWQGDVLRATHPRWVSRPYRFTGTGALLAGGRWNNPKLVPAVYLADSIHTLTAVAAAWAKRYGWKVADLKPQTRITVRLELQAVLDLRAPTTQAALGVTETQLTGCDWKAEQEADREPLTQAIGRAAFECLAEGLVAPSARHAGGANLVVFHSHRRDGTVVQAKDDASIPFVHGL